MEPIRRFIRPYCDLDPYARRETDGFYAVRTLYLDSEDYKTYWDAQEEIPSRFKLRIRTYGRNAESFVKFEIKRHFNDVCYKTSVRANEEIWARLFATRNPQGIDLSPKTANPAVQRFLGLAHAIDAEPKILIQFERQAFQSRTDRFVRISFDRRICHHSRDAYDLKAYQMDWSFNEGSVYTGEPGPHIILELKMMAHPPIWLLDLIRRFGLVGRSSSKYRTAVTRVLKREQIAREPSLSMAATPWEKRE